MDNMRYRSFVGILLHTLFVLLICLSISIVWALLDHMDGLTTMNLLNVSMESLGVVICTMIYGTIIADNRKTVENFHFLHLVFYTGVIIFCDAMNWCIDGHADLKNNIILFNSGLFIFILFIIQELWHVGLSDMNIPEATKRRLQVIMAVAIAFGVLDTLLNPWTHFIFYVNDAGFYTRGDGIALANLPALVTIFCSMYSIFRYGKNTRRKLTLVIYAFIPIVATGIQILYYGISLLYISLIISLMMIYGNFYVSRGNDLIRRESELTEERFAVMYSQIQPHFLYNALTSIMNIKGNPPETVDAIADFGKYLRGNLDTISTKHAIPVERELEHCRIYTDLEKLRFKDKLKVVYEIEDDTFFVPSLSIQMMVENAVKHGITSKEDGGSVSIHTFSDDRAHYVEITDDGLGFDTSVLAKSDVSHDGIDNVSKRLESMVSGKLSIESTTGSGTKVTITIPRAKKSGLVGRQ